MEICCLKGACSSPGLLPDRDYLCILPQVLLLFFFFSFSIVDTR